MLKGKKQLISQAVKGEGGERNMTMADGYQFWKELVKLNATNKRLAGRLLEQETVAYEKENGILSKDEKRKAIKVKATATARSAKGTKKGK